MKKKNIIILSIGIVAITGCIVFVSTQNLRTYSNAIKLFHKEKYEEAERLFEKMDSYRDSIEWANKSEYQIGLEELSTGNYDKALKIFEGLPEDYEDVQNQLKECKYLKLINDIKNNNINADTYYSLLEIEDYKDVRDIIPNVIYELRGDLYDSAISQYEIGKYKEAKELFSNFGDYNDSTQYLEYCNIMLQFQGGYDSSITNTDYLVLDGNNLIKYDTNIYNTGEISKTENKVCLIKYKNQYFLIDDIYKDNLDEAFAFYALINTDDNTAQGIDIIYSGLNFDELFVKMNDDTFKTIEEQYQIQINRKEPSIGMTADEVRESTWGEPIKINKTTTEYGVDEQWVYDDYKYIYLEDGIVTAIQG